MEKMYEKIKLKNLNEYEIDSVYEKLINSKKSFFLLEIDLYKQERKGEGKNKGTSTKKFVLTKEKSIFNIKNEKEFVEKCKQDEYYKTRYVDDEEEKIFILENKEEIEIALKEYWKNINMNKEELSKEKTLDYIFGCVAIRIGNTNSFITTIRGKKDLTEYTIVKDVDNLKKEVKVIGKKAALNAPLLYNLFFENNNAKKIIHINHKYTNDVTVEYEFPGTINDSLRNMNTSFNIRYHGFFKLYDKVGNKI